MEDKHVGCFFIGQNCDPIWNGSKQTISHMNLTKIIYVISKYSLEHFISKGHFIKMKSGTSIIFSVKFILIQGNVSVNFSKGSKIHKFND